MITLILIVTVVTATTSGKTFIEEYLERQRQVLQDHRRTVSARDEKYFDETDILGSISSSSEDHGMSFPFYLFIAHYKLPCGSVKEYTPNFEMLQVIAPCGFSLFPWTILLPCLFQF